MVQADLHADLPIDYGLFNRSEFLGLALSVRGNLRCSGNHSQVQK